MAKIFEHREYKCGYINKSLKSKKTIDLVITMFKNEMDIEMFSDEIDMSHKIGKQKDDPKKAVIVKFTKYNGRNKIFRNKKTIKRKENVHHRNHK